MYGLSSQAANPHYAQSIKQRASSKTKINASARFDLFAAAPLAFTKFKFKLLIPIMHRASSKEQAAKPKQMRAQDFDLFPAAPPAFTGWADCR